MPVESLTLPVDSPAAQVLGAAPLKPENSRARQRRRGRHADAGARRDRRLLPHRHRRPDRALRATSPAPPIAALLAPFGANSARFFTNAIDTRTNGVDVTANYRIALERGGDLRLRAGYNNTRTKIVGDVATPPQLAGFESVLFDRIEQRRIECGTAAATACASAATGGGAGSGVNVNARPLRRVLQLHAEPGRRPGVRARSG